MRYLTVALTKGRLAQKTLDMFEKIGITCEEMRDKDTRKLIFVNEELKLRFFLAKGPDVPTYVEYGAADIGVTGKDIILEEGRKMYEVMDLGFGLAVDNLLMALSRQKICLPKKKSPVILTYTEANRCEAIREAQELRSKGTSVALRREKEDC